MVYAFCFSVKKTVELKEHFLRLQFFNYREKQQFLHQNQ